jgi:hypothetical protein
VIKAIWYRPANAGFWGTLSNPASKAIELANITAHFSVIRAMGANAVVVNLPDEDGFQSGYGGGFPFNPLKTPRPDLAQAQGEVLSLAAAAGLGVIFMVSVSEYHVFIDDTYGNNKGPSAPGMWDFIHSLIDPSGFYPGAPSFIGDKRIVGWFLGGEWIVEGGEADIMARHKYFLDRYFGFFKILVHWQGAKNAFAGTYTLAGPDVAVADAVARISALAAYQPDMLGFEAYTDAPFDMTKAYMDLTDLFNALKTAVKIPPAQWLLCEAGNNQSDGPARHECITETIEAAGDYGIGGVCLWQSDGLENQQPTDKAPGLVIGADQEAYALMEATFTPAGVLTLPGAPQGWHWWKPPAGIVNPYTNPAAYLLGDQWQTAYGKIDYAPNAMGQAAAMALKNAP